jgi:protein ImuB
MSTFACLWSPSWHDSGALLAPALLSCVPRIAQRDGLLWADGRGLDGIALSASIIALLEQRAPGHDIRIGLATTPIVAQAAATRGNAPLTRVKVGDDRAFLAPLPLDVLNPDPKLDRLLEGIGVATCGELAALTRESVEVRLGPEGVDLWFLARADDPRPIFSKVPRTLPHASLEWEDYTLRDPERLLFIVNSLAERVCTGLGERGEGAREIALVLSLANGETRTEALRFARPTASRKLWMRQLRHLLDRITLPDAVTGVLLRVEAATGLHGPQGDLFDRGFASASATEQTLGDLIDDQGDVLLAPETSSHPLAEQRTRWIAQSPAMLSQPGIPAGRTVTIAPRLTLQLLPAPKPLTVKTRKRRDHEMPVSYREDGASHEVLDAAGPDRVSGGQWETAYAREYFRCVREDGLLVWLYRDGCSAGDEWYLHGWWD